VYNNFFQVKYSPNANLYVTASEDGSIKIWDGVSNKCVNTFERAHDGAPVCSVVFSRNAKVPTCVTSHFSRIIILPTLTAVTG